MRRPILIAAVAIALTGCSSGGSPAPTDDQPGTIAGLQAQAERNGWTNVSNLLKDGQVTKEDLRAAFDTMATCSKASGVTLTDPKVNPVDGWRLTFDMAGTPTASGQQAQMDCQTKEYDPISIGYEVTHKNVMDPALMKAVQACLAKRGVSTTGQEKNVPDLVPAGNADKVRADKVVACVSDEAGTMFPGETILTGY